MSQMLDDGLDSEEYLKACDEILKVLQSAASDSASTWTVEHVTRAFGWAAWLESVSADLPPESVAFVDAELARRQDTWQQVPRRDVLPLAVADLHGIGKLLRQALLRNAALPHWVASHVLAAAVELPDTSSQPHGSQSSDRRGDASLAAASELLPVIQQQAELELLAVLRERVAEQPNAPRLAAPSLALSELLWQSAAPWRRACSSAYGTWVGNNGIGSVSCSPSIISPSIIRREGLGRRLQQLLEVAGYDPHPNEMAVDAACQLIHRFSCYRPPGNQARLREPRHLESDPGLPHRSSPDEAHREAAPTERAHHGIVHREHTHLDWSLLAQPPFRSALRVLRTAATLPEDIPAKLSDADGAPHALRAPVHGTDHPLWRLGSHPLAELCLADQSGWAAECSAAEPPAAVRTKPCPPPPPPLLTSYVRRLAEHLLRLLRASDAESLDHQVGHGCLHHEFNHEAVRMAPVAMTSHVEGEADVSAGAAGDMQPASKRQRASEGPPPASSVLRQPPRTPLEDLCKWCAMWAALIGRDHLRVEAEAALGLHLRSISASERKRWSYLVQCAVEVGDGDGGERSLLKLLGTRGSSMVSGQRQREHLI